MAEQKTREWGKGLLIVAALVVGAFAGGASVALLGPTLGLTGAGGGEENVRTVNVIAYHWGFDPGEIRVQKGETIVFVVTNAHSNMELQETIYEPLEMAWLMENATMEEREAYEMMEDQLLNHSFSIPLLDVNLYVPGEAEENPVTYILVAGEPGTYIIECDVQCGPGHEEMEARLIVEG